MKRTQIYFEEDLDRDLRQVAASQGRSAAALIREAVREYLEARGSRDAAEDPLLLAVGVFAGGPTDSARHHDEYLYADDSAERGARSAQRRVAETGP
ncbi:MAG TPA: CopG family transcriptional regulator [Chloroflexota bacterium]|jgi:hypothetical protein|nr:CopG family transcriptional regulator [Chloroflexota bacterium]